MASSLRSKKFILKISSTSCSPITSPSPTPKPQSPSTPPPPPPTLPGFINKDPKSHLSPELQHYYDKVFNKLPQTPHFSPLENFKSESLRKGIRVGCDVGFLNLVQKFESFEDPSSFLGEAESLSREFDEFEEVGYDLTLLKENFNLMKAEAEAEKMSSDEIMELEEKENQKKQKVGFQRALVTELTDALETAQKELNEYESEVKKINEKKRKVMEDSEKNVHAFKSLKNLV